jgi:predicted TIM-barrel fold metal-dependent hydrolase
MNVSIEEVRSVLDFSKVPVVDAHCHSYLEPPKIMSGIEFLRYSNMLAAPPSFLEGLFKPHDYQLLRSRDRLSAMDREQAYSNLMVRWLSEFFRCKPDFNAVAAARSRRANDFDEYVRELFENVQLRGLVMDGAYPPLSDGDLKHFPAKVVKIFRLEPLINDCLGKYETFEEFCSAFDSAVRSAINDEGYVGLKTIIAYRTGLKISRVEERDAKADFQTAKDGRAEKAWFGPKVKQLRDFLIVRALELSIDLDIPMQIHTGVGDYQILLDQCDPGLLFELLSDDKLRHATVILVHSGFPNNQNAAYIASVLPNVFLDFSLTIPFLNPVSHERLMEILEVTPSSKVMYGSDALGLPEIFWFSAKLGKKLLERSFMEFLGTKVFDENEIYRQAARILYQNASKLYSLRLE